MRGKRKTLNPNGIRSIACRGDIAQSSNKHRFKRAKGADMSRSILERCRRYIFKRDELVANLRSFWATWKDAKHPQTQQPVFDEKAHKAMAYRATFCRTGGPSGGPSEKIRQKRVRTLTLKREQRCLKRRCCKAKRNASGKRVTALSHLRATPFMRSSRKTSDTVVSWHTQMRDSHCYRYYWRRVRLSLSPPRFPA